MVQIPIIDLSTATGDELVTGLQQNSCVFLTGLEWFGDELAAMLAASRTFFALPETAKEAVQWSGTGTWQGWQPVYKGGQAPMPMERYEMALPDPSTYGSTDEWAQQFDQWPDEPAEFVPTWASYYLRMRELTNRLVTMIAASLGLPAEDLAAWTERQFSNLCVNHYLPQDAPPPEGPERQFPHTDIGGLTLLWGENTPGGLHAFLGGEWVPVEFPPDCLLLQAGDLIHLWSAGTIPANLHRVVNPPAGSPPQERYSVVFFHHPDLDTWVAPELPGAAADEGVGSLDHIMARQANAYQL